MDKDERKKIENDIIDILSNEYEEKGPPAYVDTQNIAEQLNITIEVAKNVINIMHEMGMVDVPSGLHAVCKINTYLF